MYSGLHTVLGYGFGFRPRANQETRTQSRTGIFRRPTAAGSGRGIRKVYIPAMEKYLMTPQMDLVSVQMARFEDEIYFSLANHVAASFQHARRMVVINRANLWKHAQDFGNTNGCIYYTHKNMFTRIPDDELFLASVSHSLRSDAPVEYNGPTSTS